MGPRMGGCGRVRASMMLVVVAFVLLVARPSQAVVDTFEEGGRSFRVEWIETATLANVSITTTRDGDTAYFEMSALKQTGARGVTLFSRHTTAQGTVLTPPIAHDQLLEFFPTQTVAAWTPGISQLLRRHDITKLADGCLLVTLLQTPQGRRYEVTLTTSGANRVAYRAQYYTYNVTLRGREYGPTIFKTDALITITAPVADNSTFALRSSWYGSTPGVDACFISAVQPAAALDEHWDIAGCGDRISWNCAVAVTGTVKGASASGRVSVFTNNASSPFTFTTSFLGLAGASYIEWDPELSVLSTTLSTSSSSSNTGLIIGACVGAVLGGVALGLMIVFLMRSQRVRYEKRFRSATVSQMQSDNKAM